ncbi:hypothetical protein [Nitrosomonas europaea]|uniref:hypothetical protein n=1 Tax=Nitrosomonas europaea TaxID=915 RepID=UPI00079577F5|nr:hypothetical protein [Nitrosomonas europaea]KXK38343.1 MAG: hypothetical protein UZ02_AOB001002230 [Nitrosomonas europaea]
MIFSTRSYFLAVIFTILLSANSVFSQTLIENSYLITFKEGAGVIDPPNPENKGKVPVGQPTSGQDKNELAAELGLNGEIVSILETINAIAVKIDAAEAERWRQDERVQMVEQGMEGVFWGTDEPKSDYPIYRDGILSIPRVDTAEQSGLFQDGVLQFDPTVNAWRLIEFQIVPASPIFQLEGDGVETIVTDTSPTQVLLKVKGSFSNSCGVLGRINQRLEGNRFEIVINVSSQNNDSQACFPALVPFEKTIPLEVYGLPAGVYEYTVNSERFGTFELTADNNL